MKLDHNIQAVPMGSATGAQLEPVTRQSLAMPASESTAFMDRRAFLFWLVFLALPHSMAQTWLIPYHHAPYCHFCRGKFIRRGDLMRVWRHNDNFLYCSEIEARIGAPVPKWGRSKV